MTPVGSSSAMEAASEPLHVQNGLSAAASILAVLQQQDPAALAALGVQQSPGVVSELVGLLQRLSTAPGSPAPPSAAAAAAAAADPSLAAARRLQAEAQAVLAGQAEGAAPRRLEESLLASLAMSGAPSVSAAAAAATGGASLAGLHNGNVDVVFPGATATAGNLLSSGVVPAAGVASASLEGGHFGGLGLGGSVMAGSAPSVPSWSLYSFRGSFGSARGPLLLVCAFLPGSSGVSQVSFVEELGSGGEVRAVSRVILSIDRVLERCPSYAHYAPMADAWFYAALQRKYLLLPEVSSYDAFVARMRDAYMVLSDAAGGSQQLEAMRAFLELDRRLRVAQHSSGAPWHQAFKDVELCRALVSLQLRLAPAPSRVAPKSGGKGAGGGKGGKGVRCFRFDASKEAPPACPDGAACPYAAGHKCRGCGSVDHVSKACPRDGGGDA
jgi:hypothetical protein